MLDHENDDLNSPPPELMTGLPKLNKIPSIPKRKNPNTSEPTTDTEKENIPLDNNNSQVSEDK